MHGSPLLAARPALGTAPDGTDETLSTLVAVRVAIAVIAPPVSPPGGPASYACDTARRERPADDGLGRGNNSSSSKYRLKVVHDKERGQCRQAEKNVFARGLKSRL